MIGVGPLDGYRIWVRFDDEAVGQVGEVVWYMPGAEQGVDLGSDALYMELTGLTEDKMAESGESNHPAVIGSGATDGGSMPVRWRQGCTG